MWVLNANINPEVIAMPPCRGRASTPISSEKERPADANVGGWDGRISSVQSPHHFANPTTGRVTTRNENSGTRWRPHRSRTTTSFRSICDGHLHVALGHLPRQERGSGSLIMELIIPTCSKYVLVIQSDSQKGGGRQWWAPPPTTHPLC